FAASVSIDGRVWVFAAMVSVGLGAAVGLAACRCLRNLAGAGGTAGPLGRGTEARSRKRFQEIAVGTETGLAMGLLVGAGLLVQTLGNLIKTDLGFKPANVIAISASRQVKSAQEQAISQVFYSRTLDGLRLLPGVQAVGGVDLLPARLEWVPIQK